jgi:hypothetical protein
MNTETFAKSTICKFSIGLQASMLQNVRVVKGDELKMNLETESFNTIILQVIPVCNEQTLT